MCLHSKSAGEVEELTEEEIQDRLEALQFYSENPLWGYGGEW